MGGHGQLSVNMSALRLTRLVIPFVRVALHPFLHTTQRMRDTKSGPKGVLSSTIFEAFSSCRGPKEEKTFNAEEIKGAAREATGVHCDASGCAVRLAVVRHWR